MLDLNKCELIETRVANLLSTVVAVDEGTPMVLVLENGIEAVKPASGAANELFAGVAIGRNTPPTQAPYIERLTVPAGSPYTINLTKAPVGSGLGVAVVNSDGSRTVLAAGAATNTNEYSISGQTITVNSAQASKVIEVSYRYAPSFTEAMMRYSFNAFAPSLIAIPTTGLVTVGEVFVDNFDPSVNWAGYTGATPVKLGNGLFTLGGSGVSIPVSVSQVPGIDSQFLGLRINPGF